MFLASTAMYSGGISYLINSALPCWECRGLPGGNSLFFCFAKSKVSKRKGDPQSGPLCGSLKKLQETENLETCRLCRLRTSKFFNPSPVTFSSPARTGGRNGFGCGYGCGVSPHPCPLPEGEGVKPGLHFDTFSYSLSLWERVRVRVSPNPHSFPHPVLAGLEKFGRDGLKNLDVRRQRSWLVSKFSGSAKFFKEPQRGPDCGSPFFCLLFFGEAKKSELLPGNPGTPRKASQINQSAI